MASSPRQRAPHKSWAHPTRQQHQPLPCNSKEPGSRFWGPHAAKATQVIAKSMQVVLAFEFVGLLCPPSPSSSKTGCSSRDYHPTQNCHAHPRATMPCKACAMPKHWPDIIAPHRMQQRDAKKPWKPTQPNPKSLLCQTPNQKFTSVWCLSTASRLLILLIDPTSEHKRAPQGQLNSLEAQNIRGEKMKPTTNK